MTYTELFAEKAGERGITRLHFHIEEVEKKDVEIFNGAVENIGASHERLVLVEGEYGGFTGSAFTEDWDPGKMPILIENIMQTAVLNKFPYIEKPIYDIPQPPEINVDFDIRDISDEIIAAEKSARLKNTGLANFRMSVSYQKKTVTLLNGEGRSMTDKGGYFTLVTNIMAKDGDRAQTADSVRLSKGKPDFARIADDTAIDAHQMLNSESCASGRYKAIIRHSAFAELFGAFLPAFYAEKCQSKMSFLAGKQGETIGSTAITVYEDPLALMCRRFDDEGVGTGRKTLVYKGILSACFHNIRTAKKDGVSSNGNGYRQDYKESISNAYTNVVIETGEKELSRLIDEMGDGLLITDCDGVFAGVNPVSGDFSVIAKGFMIRGTKLSQPVSGVAIGGNLLEMLSNVEETGSDLVFVQTNTGIVGSGSVMLSDIIVSGKNK